MTPTEALEAAALMKEWAESVIAGKPIEIEVSDYHTPPNWIVLKCDPRWDWSEGSYRRKPQPKMVPLGPEDVPPGSVFKLSEWQKGLHQTYFQVVSGGVVFSSSQTYLTGWVDLRNYWEISRDGGKTWQRCEKPEAV